MMAQQPTPYDEKLIEFKKDDSEKSRFMNIETSELSSD